MQQRFQRRKLVYHLEPRFIAKVVDAGEVGQKIKLELFFAESACRLNLVEWKFERNFASKLGFF